MAGHAARLLKRRADGRKGVGTGPVTAYVPACSCGWVGDPVMVSGDPQESSETAWQGAERHVEGTES